MFDEMNTRPNGLAAITAAVVAGTLEVDVPPIVPVRSTVSSPHAIEGDVDSTVEASTLGWKPGHWPTSIRFAGRVLPRESLDAQGAVYADRDAGIKVTVLND